MRVGVGAAYPMLTAATVRDVSPNRYAMASAGSGTVRQLAMAAGITVSAVTINSIPDGGPAIVGYRSSWVLSVLGLTLALLMIAFYRPMCRGESGLA